MRMRVLRSSESIAKSEQFCLIQSGSANCLEAPPYAQALGLQETGHRVANFDHLSQLPATAAVVAAVHLSLLLET